MLGTNITFTGVRGVGTVNLDLQPGQQVYTFIGVNGVGKTKTLEALFQFLLSSNLKFITYTKGRSLTLVFDVVLKNNQFIFDSKKPETLLKRNFIENPVIFLASQNRGFIRHENKTARNIGNLRDRRVEYFFEIIRGMGNNFASLNMDSNLEEWFITLAQSANPYQKKEDNREVEIKTILRLLHKIDHEIDPNFLEISGDNRVSLKIKNEKREISHLSTGFASILKIIQSIISGYSYFTNEQELQKVNGIVLIDEIESHLHISWQTKIIPLLKNLFPNTQFYISTHSSIVLSQLKEGEAYRLERDTQGLVHTHLIKSPNHAAIIDVLKDAFGVDLNKMKLERMSASDQYDAKQRLLALINQ
ncbi:MAG: AAA family ATPase [Thiolinea sp.]